MPGEGVGKILHGMTSPSLEFGQEFEYTWKVMKTLLEHPLRQADTVTDINVDPIGIQIRVQVYHRLYDAIFRSGRMMEITAEIYRRVMELVSEHVQNIVNKEKCEQYYRIASATGKIHLMLRRTERLISAIMPNFRTKKFIYGDQKSYSQSFQGLLSHALRDDFQITGADVALDISRAVHRPSHNIDNSLIMMYVLRETPPSIQDKECEKAFFETIIRPYSCMVEGWSSCTNILQFAKNFDPLRTAHLKEAIRFVPELTVLELRKKIDELTVGAFTHLCQRDDCLLVDMFEFVDFESLKFVYSKMSNLYRGVEQFGEILRCKIKETALRFREEEPTNANPIDTSACTVRRLRRVVSFIEAAEAHTVESFAGDPIMRDAMIYGIKDLVNPVGGETPYLGQDRLAKFADHILTTVSSPRQANMSLLKELLHWIGKVSKCLDNTAPFLQNCTKLLSVRLLKMGNMEMEAEEAFFEILLKVHGINKLIAMETNINDIKKCKKIAGSFNDFRLKRRNQSLVEQVSTNEDWFSTIEPNVTFEAVEEDLWPDISKGPVYEVDRKKDTEGHNAFLETSALRKMDLKRSLLGTSITIETDVFSSDDCAPGIRITMNQLQYDIFNHVETTGIVSYVILVEHLTQKYECNMAHKRSAMEKAIVEVLFGLVFGEFKLLRTTSASETIENDDAFNINNTFVPPSSEFVLP